MLVLLSPRHEHEPPCRLNWPMSIPRGVCDHDLILAGDCDYHPGGCSISKAAPPGTACKCVYKGAWTCGGDVVRCGNPKSPLCAAPSKGPAACVLGGGDCGGYSGSSDCDCDYKGKGLFKSSGCKIVKAAREGRTQAHCVQVCVQGCVDMRWPSRALQGRQQLQVPTSGQVEELMRRGHR